MTGQRPRHQPVGTDILQSSLRDPIGSGLSELCRDPANALGYRPVVPTSFQLVAIARNGTQQTWDAELERDASEWTYRVTASTCRDFYEARFKEVGTDVIQPDVLDRHDDAFRGKGLTEALFQKVVQDSGRSLVSSTNAPTRHFPNEYRTNDADRIWRRLFAEGRAETTAQWTASHSVHSRSREVGWCGG